MLADRWNKRTLVIIGLLVFSVAGALLGFNFSLWFLLIGFIATAGDELSSVSLWAWMDTLDKNHSQDGLVNGIITFFEDLGWAIGPILAGVLFNIIGPSWIIAIGAGILFLAWFTALIFLRYPSAAYSGVSRQFSSPTRQRHKR